MPEMPPLQTVLWALVLILLASGLLAAFGYLLLRRRKAVRAALRRVDDQLRERAPGLRRFVRQRFSREAWTGLTLTGAVGTFLGAVYLFAEVTDSWMDQETFYHLDQRVLGWVNQLLSEEFVQAMHVVTYFGDAFVVAGLVAVTGLLLWRRRAWERLGALVLVVGGGQAVVYVLKWIFSRTRPEGGATTPIGASFPSGHTFSATVLYGFLILLAWRYVHSWTGRILLTLGLSTIILLVGLSRVVLRVHWVSDVVGGWIVGLAWLILALLLTHAIYMRWGRTRA